jgi:plastocyanin
MKRAAALLLSILALGCGRAEPPGGSGAASPSPPPEPGKVEPRPATPGDAPKGAASIRGVVRVTGTPARGRARLTDDCAALHAGPLLLDDVVADAQGRLQWAFVYIKKGLEGRRYPPPAAPVVIDQRECRYEPHVVGMVAGQRLKVTNSDDLLHNVHGLPFANREWNWGQPRKGAENEITLQVPEVMIRMKCDIHPWMSAWIGVLEHPFFAVTGPDGSFAIEGLPDGRYVLEVWHEAFESIQREMDLKSGESRLEEFVLEKKKG